MPVNGKGQKVIVMGTAYNTNKNVYSKNKTYTVGDNNKDGKIDRINITSRDKNYKKSYIDRDYNGHTDTIEETFYLNNGQKPLVTRKKYLDKDKTIFKFYDDNGNLRATHSYSSKGNVFSGTDANGVKYNVSSFGGGTAKSQADNFMVAYSDLELSEKYFGK